MCANLVLWILQILLVLLFDLKLHPFSWCCRTLGDRRKEVGRKKWEEQDLWRHDKTATHLSFVCASMAVAVLVIGEGGRKKIFCAWAFFSSFLCVSWIHLFWVEWLWFLSGFRPVSLLGWTEGRTRQQKLFSDGSISFLVGLIDWP